MPLQRGQPAPAFSLDSTTGQALSLADFRGKKIVLYFYPKDDTPGCTTEACNFRDTFADLTAAGAVVLGVSPDTVASHEQFRTKYHLPFILLADPDHRVAEQYGVWKLKPSGNMGIERTTFLIDGEGRLAKIFSQVKPAEHHTEVLTALETVP